MEREEIIIVFIISLLILSGFVYAAGTSTRDSEDEESIDCDSQLELNDRIKCRIENRATLKEEYAGSEEACRGLVTENACNRLYQVSEACYDKSEIRERVSCLRSSAGIERAIEVKLASEENKRNYAVLLLYELQERVEKALDSGKLTEDEAASIITRIVETKRTILEGKSKEEIKTELNSLRSLWQETFK